MEYWLFQIFYTVLGLIIGSFLTVCIYRIPYGREKGPGDFGEEFDEDGEALEDEQEEEQGERLSIAYPPRSFCPHCRAQLLWWHNIPVISWLLLRGKCHFCKTGIPFRYPAVELFTCITCIMSFNKFPVATAILVFAFCCALIVLSVIDAEYYILPDVITLPMMLLGLMTAVVNHFTGIFIEPVSRTVPEAFWGLLCGGGFLFFVSEVYFRLRNKVGLGFGDVKLLAGLGLFFGPLASLYTIFVGSLIGTVLGVAQMLLLRNGLGKPLPFGPYLASATYAFIFTSPNAFQKLLGFIRSLTGVFAG